MLIRQLYREFDPCYLRPKIMLRAAQHVVVSATQALTATTYQPRYQAERRQQERRCQHCRVLVNLRSPHARRRSTGRRQQDQAQINTTIGIDVYA